MRLALQQEKCRQSIRGRTAIFWGDWGGGRPPHPPLNTPMVGSAWWILRLFRTMAGQLFLEYVDAVGWVF